MADGTDIASQIWSELRRKEEGLKTGGHHAWFGQSSVDIGRPADEFHGFGLSAREQLGRVDRVRTALYESGPRAQRMLVLRLAGIDLSGIGPVLVSACEDIALIYGGSVVAGAFVGAVGGTLLGGIGAVPGAAAGAAAGSYLGGWVLALLGLQALAEHLSDAFPRALDYYERGFKEAWGPPRHQRAHPGICTTACSEGFAADDFAHGHVIMAAAILTALVAYLSRGKGDRGALMKDISRSPRLGPKVAQWLEQNEARLRQHPALESRATGTAGSRVSPRADAPHANQGREPVREPERRPSSSMPKTVVPCFKTKGLAPAQVPEFDRQLDGQEAGINSMTVEEYINGRNAFDAKDVVRNPTLARQERAAYQQDLERDLTREYQSRGLSVREAERKASDDAIARMKVLAALHTPDMVAGGKDVVGDFGDRKINSRIGAQWRRGRRLTEVDDAANAIPARLRGTTKMNVKLERCK